MGVVIRMNMAARLVRVELQWETDVSWPTSAEHAGTSECQVTARITSRTSYIWGAPKDRCSSLWVHSVPWKLFLCHACTNKSSHSHTCRFSKKKHKYFCYNEQLSESDLEPNGFSKTILLHQEPDSQCNWTTNCKHCNVNIVVLEESE